MVKQFHLPKKQFNKIGKAVKGGIRKVHNSAKMVAKKSDHLAKVVGKVAGSPAVIGAVGAAAPELLPVLAGAKIASRKLHNTAKKAVSASHPDKIHSGLMKAKGQVKREMDTTKFH